jgi:transposase
MAQRGQVFPLKSAGGAAESWAYRCRTGGRDSKRVQRGGFPTRLAAEQALERALQRLRQEQRLVETPTLSEFVDVYLAQHDAEPETIAELRWLLSKATAAFGELAIS